MRILGTYSIKIITYDAKDLELEHEYDDIAFNLYQKIFYLFLIPVWPLDKHWEIKKDNRTANYISDSHIRTKLNLIEGKSKTPIWAFLGAIVLSIPILLLIGFLVINLSDIFFYERHKKNKIGENTSIAISRIQNPNINDIYEIRQIQVLAKKNRLNKIIDYKQEWGGDYDYKLTNFSKDSLLLIKESKYRSDKKMIDTIATSKSDLIKLAKEYTTFNMVKQDPNEDSLSNSLYRIRKVKRTVN